MLLKCPLSQKMTLPSYFTEETENFKLQMGFPTMSYHQNSSCLHWSPASCFSLWLRHDNGFQTVLHREGTSRATNWLWLSPSNKATF